MNEENKIVRFVLEGIDNLSKAYQGARKNVESENKKILESTRNTNRDLKKDYDETGRSLNRLGKQYRELRNEITRTVGGRAAAFQEGKASADRIYESIRRGLRATQEQRREALAALEQQRRIDETNRKVRNAQRGEELKQDISNVRARADEEIQQVKRISRERRAQLEQDHRAAIEALKNDLRGNKQDALSSLSDQIARTAQESAVRRAAILAERDVTIAGLRQAGTEGANPAERAANRQAAQELIAQERQATRERIAAEDASQRKRLEELKAAHAAVARNDTAEVEKQIREQRTAHLEEIERDKMATEDRVRTIQQRVVAQTGTLRTSETSRQAEESLLARNEYDRQRLAIRSPDAETVIRDAITAEKRLSGEAEKTGSSIDQAFRRAGRGIGDFRTGLRIAENGLTTTERTALRMSSRMTRLGAEVGRAASQVKNFVNIKWFLLTSALQLVGNLVVTLGANLISLASSAAYAAAALGGAFVAGLTQAIPVLGLVVAAFQRVTAVFKAVQTANQAKTTASQSATQQADAERQSAERLADSHYALTQAYQGVADAQYNVSQAAQGVTDAMRQHTQAIQDLADARKQAARDIVDANLSERDAALSLKEAELGVLQAKQRLADLERQQRQGQANVQDAQAAVREAQARLAEAKKQGDRVEIAQAQSALNTAQQNASNIQDSISQNATQLKQAQLEVDRAKLSRDEAVVRNRRAQEDAKKARQDGVEGNRQVVQARQALEQSVRAIAQAEHQQAVAQRNVADSLHQVVIAQRNVRDAQIESANAAKQQNSQAQAAANALKGLDPAERQLYAKIQRLLTVYKQVSRPITDIIINAFSRLTDRIVQLLQDPKIQRAFSRLATAIAQGIDKFGAWLTNPNTRRQLTFFIEEATRNMPKLVDLFLHLLRIIGNIGEAAAPIFSDLLTGADNLLGRAEKWTAPRQQDARGTRPDDRGGPRGGDAPGATSPLQRFLKTAADNLGAWLKLIGAITRFVALLFGTAQPSGRTLVGQITAAFNAWGDWIRDHPRKVQKFFDDMRVALGRLAHTLGVLAAQLVETFSSKGAENFTNFILEVVIPGLILFIKTLQIITGIFNSLTNLPVIGELIKFVAQLGFAYLLIGRLFPIFRAFLSILKLLRYAFIVLRVALIALAEGNPIAWIITAVIVIGYLLYKLGLLKPLLHAIAVAFTFLWDGIKRVVKAAVDNIVEFFQHPIRWLQKNWWTLLKTAIMGPFGLLLLVLKKFFPGLQDAIVDGFLGAFARLGRWFAGIGAWINTHIIQPVMRAFGIASPSKVFFEIGMSVVEGFLNAIKKLPGLVLAIFKKIPTLIIDLFKDLGKKITEEIAKHIPAPLRKAAGYASKALGAATDPVGTGVSIVRGVLKASGGDIASSGPHGTDTVPAWLTPGEWVLNQAQQSRLAQHFKTSREQVSAWLFGTSMGKTKPGPTTTNTTKSVLNPYSTPNFTLFPQTDSDNNTVWFIEFGDKTYGQITAKDAKRMMSSNGTWFPGYAKRASRDHRGFYTDPNAWKAWNASIKGLRTDAFDRRFSMGGIVPQHLASGGPVLTSPQGDRPGSPSKTINQHFEAKIMGDTDWNYVMRLGAQHAQESY
jgi:hypothetical protein